jgi:hypothetical protein
MKVQCIKNKSGFYKHIKIGEWYETESRTWDDADITDKVVIKHLFKNENGVYAVTLGVYDKSMFRTLEEKRDIKLRKILKN